MGGRGASSGMSVKGKKYGTEYTTLYKADNIKFIKYNDATSAKTPMETMTKGRVYVTVNSNDDLVSITYYDSSGKRNKQIDLTKPHADLLPHTHHGYEHNEDDGVKGATRLTPKEQKMVERVKTLWYNRNKK